MAKKVKIVAMPLEGFHDEFQRVQREKKAKKKVAKKKVAKKAAKKTK